MGDGDSALTYTNLDHTWFVWPRDLHSLGNDVLGASLTLVLLQAERESRMLCWYIGQSRDSNFKLFPGYMSLCFFLGFGSHDSRHCTGLQNKASGSVHAPVPRRRSTDPLSVAEGGRPEEG